MTVTITGDTSGSTVSMDFVSISEVHTSSEIDTYIFGDGTDVEIANRKTGDGLTIETVFQDSTSTTTNSGTVTNDYSSDPSLTTESGDSTGAGHKIEYDSVNDRLNFESYRQTDTTYQYYSLSHNGIQSDVSYTANLNINDDNGRLQYGLSSYVYLYDSSGGGYIRIEMDMDEDQVSAGKIGIKAMFYDGSNNTSTGYIEISDGSTVDIRVYTSGNTGYLDVDGTTDNVDISSLSMDDNNYNRIRFLNGGVSGSSDSNGIDGWIDNLEYKYEYTTTTGSSASYYTNTLNTIMDNMETVTLSGMDDTNLNTEYYISNLEFNRPAGQPDIYNCSITLERKYDRLY